MSKYRLSTQITQEMMNDVAVYALSNNLKYLAVVVDSAVTKMTMNRAVKSTISNTYYFDNMDEAKAWLKEKGF